MADWRLPIEIADCLLPIADCRLAIGDLGRLGEIPAGSFFLMV
jgi:hypothetical protein